MKTQEFIDWLMRQRGVVRAEVISPELIDKVRLEESTVMSSLGTPVRNSGLDDCLSRDTVVIAFTDWNFWQPPTKTMLLCNSDGSVVGHDIPAALLPEYRDRCDLVFLSDDFVMMADACMDEAPYMDMISQIYTGEDGSLPPETDAVLWFPSTTSSTIIHEALGQPDNGLATAMIGIRLDD